MGMIFRLWSYANIKRRFVNFTFLSFLSSHNFISSQFVPTYIFPSTSIRILWLPSPVGHNKSYYHVSPNRWWGLYPNSYNDTNLFSDHRASVDTCVINPAASGEELPTKFGDSSPYDGSNGYFLWNLLFLSDTLPILYHLKFIYLPPPYSPLSPHQAGPLPNCNCRRKIHHNPIRISI